MAKDKGLGPLGPSKIEATALNATESRAKLAQHMAVLQGFGFSDLGSLGKLDLGLKGKPEVAILQRSGVVLPSQAGPFQPQPEAFGVARRDLGAGNFQNFTGNAWVASARPFPTGAINPGPISTGGGSSTTGGTGINANAAGM